MQPSPSAARNVRDFPNIPGCKLLGIAGQGGMGTVYRAEQASPHRIVAVKVLSQAAANPQTLAAFQREAETIAHLEHPNILPVYGFGQAAGRPYLILRYLGGGTVATRLRQAPIDLPTAARWVRAVSSALDFAHARGLVHRDVKPSNLLLDEAGNAYLTDFGIAAALAAAGGELVSGSAAYMSPEQAAGGNTDRRSDLYSLAVSLFEMLTGQQPYTAETPLGVIVRHINDPVPSARALNPAIPPAVDALIQRGMAKDPADRPQSALEFAQLLDSAIAGRDSPPVAPAPAGGVPLPNVQRAATPGPAAVSVEPRPRPNLLIWIGLLVVGLCLLIVLALGGGGLLYAIFAPPQATPTIISSATAPPPDITPSPVGQLLADDFTDARVRRILATPDVDGGVAYAAGALRISVLTLGHEYYWYSNRVQAQDVQIDVDLQQQSGPARVEMGAICRWRDEQNFTAFAISGERQFKIWQLNGGTLTRLVDWTDAPSLAAIGSAPHHLTVICAGSQLTLQADGRLVGQAQDPAPTSGDVALFAGLRVAGKLGVDFHALRVKQP